MKRALLAFLLLVTSAIAADDPIVGRWSVDQKPGETDVDLLTFSEDGKCSRDLLGSEIPGKWRHSNINKAHYLSDLIPRDAHFTVGSDTLTWRNKSGVVATYSRQKQPARKPAAVVDGNDPVIGEWLWQEKYTIGGHDWIFRADGSLVMRSAKTGESSVFGKWRKLDNGTYKCDRLENDHWAIVDGKLNAYDGQGLIRSYRRGAGGK